jgi:hypothetical protein
MRVSLYVEEISTVSRGTRSVFTLSKNDFPFVIPQSKRAEVGVVDNRFAS